MNKLLYEQTNLFGDSNGLKFCPFCGGTAEYKQFFNPNTWFYVQCSNCGCRTDGVKDNRSNFTSDESKKINAAIWNKRVKEDY